jgi:dTDP-glucose 4,6-dehydratase/UDP-glucuronate decarboxylase
MILNICLFGKECLYNVGGKSKISIFELANKISDILNKSVVVSNSQNIIKGNPGVVNISIEKYCKEFNKESFVSLDDGLKKTIEWQKKLYNNENKQNFLQGHRGNIKI